MTQNPGQQGPIVPIQPQPNIYTVLLIIAVFVLAVAFGVAVHNLIANYGMTFGDIFGPSTQLPPTQ